MEVKINNDHFDEINEENFVGNSLFTFPNSVKYDGVFEDFNFTGIGLIALPDEKK